MEQRTKQSERRGIRLTQVISVGAGIFTVAGCFITGAALTKTPEAENNQTIDTSPQVQERLLDGMDPFTFNTLFIGSVMMGTMVASGMLAIDDPNDKGMFNGFE